MTPSRSIATVICFIKNPEAGKVKTRLAKDLGDQEALEVYHRLLKYTREVLDPLQVRKKRYFSNRIEKLPYWEDNGYESRVQSGGNLGARLAVTFSTELSKSEKVIIIGSDCAELKTRHIKEALDALESNEVVIGPARDGGYYLIGLRKFIPGLFEDMPWSEPQLLEETLSFLDKKGHSYKLIEELSDVDDLKDWQRVDWK